MPRRPFKEHDLVVFRVKKHGPHPGPRARDVRPARMGDDYDYVVDKYWTVVEVRQDGTLLLRTPGGKLREASAGDSRLRRPGLRDWVWLLVFGRERLRAHRRKTV